MGEKSVKFICPKCGEVFEIANLKATNLSDKETAMNIRVRGNIKPLQKGEQEQ